MLLSRSCTGLFRARPIAARLQSYTCCHSKKQEPKVGSLGFWSDPLVWERTRLNTLRCLVGCTMGDFSAMWYMQLNHPEMSPVVCTGLAMAAGLSTSLALETVLLRRSLGVSVQAAFKTAMGMSFASMCAMELAENAVDWHLTGGQVAFDDPHFWMAAIASMAAGYIVPLPFNYWRLKALGKACH
ncbi:hypothetical protein CLU79DRAFT_700636 [Phycomyces nitens]|nr:hypothetical protein CLU79DRAFT_700636 [Phycomyces nitens]